MSNIAGKAYAMNVITPMKPSRTKITRFLFMMSRSIPSTLQGLLGLSIIHFARWVIIKREQWPDMGGPENDGIEKQNLKNDYMLFCSNFNGTWDQYIDAFSDGIPGGLDLLWYTSTKYPHSIPITPFKNYIVHNQLTTDYYYNATPGAAQRDIKAAIRVYDEIKQLQKLHENKSVSPQEFQKAYNKALTKLQNSLPSTGFAPVASVDSDRASEHRIRFVNYWNRTQPKKIA